MQIKDLSKELKITNKELIAFYQKNGYEVKNHMQNVDSEMEALARGSFDTEDTVEAEPVKTVEVKKDRVFDQHDPILCRSVCPGWLGVSGKSGQLYVFSDQGDEQEIEYQDLFALKNSRSPYLYKPLFIIEDEELLALPRWKDIAKFYNENIYGVDNVEAVLDLPLNTFKHTLDGLPEGLKRAVVMEVSSKIEDGTFDSLQKINIIDDICGTDLKHMIKY